MHSVEQGMSVQAQPETSEVNWNFRGFKSPGQFLGKYDVVSPGVPWFSC